MEKKSIVITIIVVALVAGFITELFFFGGSYTLNLGGSAAPGAKNVTGSTAFNGSIRTYDPVLGIPANTSQAVVDQLRRMPGVKDVRVQASLILVETETRDDVYPLAVALRQMNVSPVTAVANIAIPPDLEVATYNGSINASTLNTRGVVRVETEPFVDAGTEVPVTMAVVVSEGMLIDYYSARVMVERRSVTANATVAELANMTFVYTIPWEDRSRISLGGLDGYSYDYKKVNTIMLSPQLNITGVLAKKQLPYITFIDQASAETAPDFADSAAVRGDFAETNVTFPPSTLTAIGQSAPPLAAPDGADYPPAVSYTYKLVLPQSAEGYELGNVAFMIKAAGPLELNATVPLNVTILAIGANVLSVTSPSGLSS